MKKVIWLIALSAIVFATPMTITTGSKKGTYYKIGLRIASNLQGYNVVNSKGSVENLNRLLNGDAQVGIAQLDAFRWFVKKHPEAEEKIELLGTLKKECVMLVVPTDGKVSSDSDLQKKNIKIAVGKNGSGTQVTWEYMGMLEDGFKKATAIPKGGSRALAKVASKKYDAMLSVMTPDVNSHLFSRVRDNKKLKFASIKDWDLNDKYNGTPIYTFDTVTTEKGFFNETVNTICTQSAVFIRSDMDEDMADELADFVLSKTKYLVGGE